MTHIARKVLVIGLGNPGPEFTNTRHNVGFMALDFLAGDKQVWDKDKSYLAFKVENTIFIKPQTFVNLSGHAVLAAMTKYRVSVDNVTVIHDDIDLKLGDIRTKIGGSDAGHNGLKSITAAIGSNYKRIRIGTDRPEEKVDIVNWVTGRFSKEELKIISDIIKKISI